MPLLYTQMCGHFSHTTQSPSNKLHQSFMKMLSLAGQGGVDHQLINGLPDVPFFLLVTLIRVVELCHSALVILPEWLSDLIKSAEAGDIWKLG